MMKMVFIVWAMLFYAQEAPQWRDISLSKSVTQQEMSVAECHTTTPYDCTIAAEMWWEHKNPDNPSQWWGWWTGFSVPIYGGLEVIVVPESSPQQAPVKYRYEGTPVQVTVVFKEYNGPRYTEFKCGQHPWVVFKDGFESGNTGNWQVSP